MALVKNKKKFSRKNPSPEYARLLDLYVEMHNTEGRKSYSKDKTVYPGKSLLPYVGLINYMCKKYSAKTLLDYGAGKGKQYSEIKIKIPKTLIVYRNLSSYWGVDVSCYDPGNKIFSKMPGGKFDGVICCDVLEHCPRQDVRWIIEELFQKSKKFVFANIACYPAQTILPNGENAHAIIEPPAWWREVISEIASRYPKIEYVFNAETIKNKSSEYICSMTIPHEGGALNPTIIRKMWLWSLVKMAFQRVF